MRNSKINPRKTSSNLQKGLQYSGVKITASLVRRLVLAGRKARRPQWKQLLTEKMRKKRNSSAKKYKEWRAEDRKKVLFSDESHFLVQGQHCRHVRRSDGEKITKGHIIQKAKHPQKENVLGLFQLLGCWTTLSCYRDDECGKIQWVGETKSV